MKNRREEMLREMGIAPIWHLRAQAGGAVAEPAVVAERIEAPVAEVAPAVERKAPQTAAPVAAVADDFEARRVRVEQMDWPALKETVAGCTACPLHKGRCKTVFGVGDEAADWLFVGEGPGADEDREGEPFVGQAGKLLDSMLAAVQLARGQRVYIANVVKCRPPGNRNPEPGEAKACEPYLQRQIALIKPKLIVALGKVAAVNLLGRDAPVASLRGKVHRYGDVPLIVTYHPAYLLRSLPDKSKAWADLCFALDTMAALQSDAPAPI